MKSAETPEQKGAEKLPQDAQSCLKDMDALKKQPVFKLDTFLGIVSQYTRTPEMQTVEGQNKLREAGKDRRLLGELVNKLVDSLETKDEAQARRYLQFAYLLGLSLNPKTLTVIQVVEAKFPPQFEHPETKTKGLKGIISRLIPQQPAVDTEQQTEAQVLADEITKQKTVPEEIKAALASLGWATPEDKAKLEADASLNREKMLTTLGEKNDIEKDRQVLTGQVNTFKSRVAELQETLATRGIESADALQKIQQLQQQLEAITLERDTLISQSKKTPTDTIPETESPASPPTAADLTKEAQETIPTESFPPDDLRLKFQYFCDMYLGAIPESAPKERDPNGSSLQSRQETQTSFLKKDQSAYNPRYGIYRLINSLFGHTVTALGEPIVADQEGKIVSLGNGILDKVDPQRSQQIGQLIDLLSQGTICEELGRNMVEGLSGKREWYDYYSQTEVFFVGNLPRTVAETESKGQRYEKSKFYLNLPVLLSSVQALGSRLESLQTTTTNPLLTEMARSFKEVGAGKLVQDLQQIARAYPDVFKEGYMANLEEKTVNGKKASDLVIGIFKDNKNDCEKLTNICRQLGTLLPIAAFHREIKARTRIDTPLVTPSKDPDKTELVLHDARNPYAVLLSMVNRGKPLSAEDSGWFHSMGLSESASDGWPPKLFSYSPYIRKALENERPINLTIREDRPIILLTGNNGAGKTHAMENFVQTMANALVTGTNQTARVVRLSQMREIRSLVGAARHSVELSSFQREAVLVADAITTLSNKPRDEKAILVVDEVGKGTDSRDAIALMTATAEYCRRNNIYLLMATHHGQEFMRLANQLGLNQYIRIFTPNFETHELEPQSEPKSSEGVEVMYKRAKQQNLASSVADILAANAHIVRQAIQTNTIPHLKEVIIQAAQSKEQFSFADMETLADIGLSYENHGSNNESDYGTKPLRESARKVAGVISWSVKSVWDHTFLERQKEVGRLDDSGRVNEHALIDALVQYVRQSPEGQAGFMRTSGVAFETARILFSHTLSDKNLAEVSARYDRFTKDIGGYLSWGYSEKSMLDEFFSQVNNPDSLAKSLQTIQGLGESLVKSDLPPLASLGRKFIGFASLHGELDRVLATADIETKQTFTNYMKEQAVKALRYRHSSLTDQDAISLAKAFNIPGPVTVSLFEDVARKIESGDQATYATFSQWLIDSHQQKLPSYQSQWTTQDRIFHEAKLYHIVEAARTVQSGRQGFLKDNQVEGVSLTQDLQPQIVNTFLAGDPSPLFSLIKLANQGKVYFDYNSGGEIARMVENLNTGKFFAWVKYLEKSSPSKEDLYAAIGVSDGATVAEIRTACRKIAFATHPDQAIQRARDRGVSGEASTTLAEADKEKYKQASEALSILTNSERRILYDRDRNVNAALNMAYYSTIVNAIASLDWCKPTYSTDGSLNIKNSLAVGLLSKIDASEIIRQSLSIRPETEAVVIGGSNGNGKSQLLIQLASAFEWARMTGYVPAEKAVLPKINFFTCMVNAGESTEGKSSFQNEIDRYINLFDRYIKAGAPTNGIIFLDEPLAGTSSEDQIGILLSMIEFFRQRNVKIVFTNHNYRTYEYMRRVVGSNGSHIKFKPVAFLSGKDEVRYKLSEFDPSNTDSIRSDGIRAAGEFGVPDEIIQIALFARDALTGKTSIN